MKATYVRAGATFIAMPIVGWFCFQAASIYFTIQKMWLWGYTWQGFLPYAWASAILGGIIVFGLSWITRPKNPEPETNSLSKKDKEAILQKWQLVEKAGTEDQKKQFMNDNAEFFGIPQKAETVEPNFNSHSLSPKERTPPTPPALPIDVTKKDNLIIIRFDTSTQPTTAIQKQNNGGFSDNFKKRLEDLALKQLETGEWEPDFKLNVKNGNIELPEKVGFKPKKQDKTETPKKPESKTEPKHPRLKRL